MRIVQLTPGSGPTLCGNCLRDNALVAEMRRRGHDVVMVPLYLPLTLDEKDESAGIPVFFGGVNVFLEQKSALFRAAPEWLHAWLDSPAVLKWASGRVGTTPADGLGELTLSMLRGEAGHQARELRKLIAWMKTQAHPDVCCLSNALLLGLGPAIRRELDTAVVCTLQGEEYFLDCLPEPVRSACWETLRERAREIDLFIAPSRFFARRMAERMGLPEDKVVVAPNGIQPWESGPAREPSPGPVIGFFARMCPEKGLDILVEAFQKLHARGRFPGLELRIGGTCGPGEQPFVGRLRATLRGSPAEPAVRFFPNLDREAKRRFFHSLDVFSVPATYGEAFGLYLLEAFAAGVPVVQPDTAAFPELVAATGGGLLCKPGDPASLAETLEELLADPARRAAHGESGRSAFLRHFTTAAMTDHVLRAYERAAARP